MNSELAQLVFLTSFGNATLAGDPLPPTFEEWRGNDVFTWVRSVQFSEPSKRMIAKDPVEWLSTLRQQGAKRLWLFTGEARADIPTHNAEAFSGGVSRGIRVDDREIWLAHWEFDDQVKGWDVEYRSFPETVEIEMNPDLGEIENELAYALDAAREFAGSNNQGQWEAIFADARGVLDGGATSLPRKVDALSPRYTVQAHHLIRAAEHAWVFGGMGSWNDLWFDDQGIRDVYDAVTTRLYGAVISAITGAANSFTVEP